MFDFIFAFALSVAKVAEVAGFTGVHGLKLMFNIYNIIHFVDGKSSKICRVGKKPNFLSRT